MQPTTSSATRIQAALQTDGFVLLDGSLATMLERQGHDISGPLWTARCLLESPAAIAEVHYRYLLAGSRVLTTASYQATLEGFAAAGLSTTQAAATLRLTVQLARDACARFLAESTGQVAEPLVAASIGPYGAYLHDGSEYTGAYHRTARELKAFHRPRLEILLEAEPDMLLLETIPSRREAFVLLELLDEMTALPAAIAFVCRDTACIADGDSFASAVAEAASLTNIVAAGVNCTPPQFLPALLTSAMDSGHKPLLAYPSSAEHAARQLAGSASKAQPIRDWAAPCYASGARWFGGCCGTDDAFIGRLAEALHQVSTGQQE